MSRLTTLHQCYTTARHIKNPYGVAKHLCNAVITAETYFSEPFITKMEDYCHDWQDCYLQDSFNKQWHYCDICALGQDLNQINQLLEEIQSCILNN